MEQRKHKMPLTGLWIVLLLGCITLCRTAPTIAPTISPEEEDLAEGYLTQFYSDVGMKNSSTKTIKENTFSQDLQAMQAFFGLEVTGVLNNETVEVMKAPRCGVSDISRYGHFAGKPKWQKRLITYRYDEGRNQMDLGYPRSITQDFPGIGSKVDAAFENIGYLYFSSGPRQSEYYLPNKRVLRVLFNYGWLNCY